MTEGTRTTIADVARRAGVDRAVVSKVLSNDPGLRVREETRERVRRAAEELRYLPNYHARRLATAKTGAFGLLVPDFRNPVYTEIIAGAEAVASERGSFIWTASADGYSVERYLALLRGGLVDALLVAGSHSDLSSERLFAETRVPVLLVNRRAPGARRWVILDDERAAQVATQHLIDLGHRRIGFVDGPSWADTAARRRRGYLGALRRAGLIADDTAMVQGEYTPAGGASAADALLAAPQLPSAVVVANAPMAVGLWHRLTDRGIAIPAALSLVAIHRLPLEEYRVPPLTFVELPLRRLGRRAAELVLDTPADEPIREVVRDEVVLVEGGTVAPFG